MANRLARTVSIPLAATTTFVGVYVLTPPGRSDASAPPVASAVQTVVSTTYYPNCKAAWAAGAAPIYRGQPGYREDMDGDDDGIACEPFRGR
jgi:Excalibur calcium-binding domain